MLRSKFCRGRAVVNAVSIGRLAGGACPDSNKERQAIYLWSAFQ